MKWAVIIFSLLTVFLAILAMRESANVRHAEDNWNVVFFGIGALVCGAIDFILIIIWLAIT